MNARLRAQPGRFALLGAIAVLSLLVCAAAAPAQGPPRFHRGHLPAIGQIELAKTARGRVAVSVPVTYTKAISGRAAGLETAEVTLHVARSLVGRSPVGVAVQRTHRHRLAGSGTVVDRFVLGRKASRWLLGKSRRQRGRLVRVDVRHRIREHRGGRALHEKDASSTMVSSHRVRAAGEEGQLTLRNDTAVPLNTVSTPILCMYTDGEEGSNLQAFTTDRGEPVWPGGTIEARVEADGSIFDTAHYQGPRGESAGAYIDWIGIGVEFLANEFDIELTPFSLLVDMTTNCFGSASTFQMVAAEAVNPEREAEAEAPIEPQATSEAWVLTSQDCSHGCPQSSIISAFHALEYQGIGEEQVNPGIWARESTPILEALAGGWRQPPVGGKIVKDEGLHWAWQELPEREEEIETFDGEEFTITEKVWEVSVHEGSSSAGFSG